MPGALASSLAMMGVAALAGLLVAQGGHGIDGQDVTGMVRPSGFEPPTFCSGGKRSIQLSYGRTEMFQLYRNGSLPVG